MQRYRIPVSWEMSAIVEVDAETLEEAINKAYAACNVLPRGEYVDDSFRVNTDDLDTH